MQKACSAAWDSCRCVLIKWEYVCDFRGKEMKRFNVCGLGNGIVDIFLEVKDDEFETLNLERGSMRLVTPIEQQALIDRFKSRSPKLSSGGSVANSLIALAQLGGKGAFLCSLGDDRYGIFYKGEFDTFGIALAQPMVVGEMTGTCVALITPDAERTMCTSLGAAAKVSPHHVDAELIGSSEWLFIEGYLFLNPEYGIPSIKRAVEIAVEHGTRIAVTISEDFVVHAQREELEQVLRRATLVFANEREACALTSASNYREAFERLCAIVPAACVTAGPRGAIIKYDGVVSEIAAYPCTPVDLTGAGDMFAGAFLYGVTHGYSPADAARGACCLASHVIRQYGARLHSGVREFWDDAVATRSAANT